ncbi:hypothetical protein F4820DRAFT_252951 [Hypoxylon rubiginosum]|uniref:Uncharacterized protein n=1 Tax=Hypoxylon rubiginosum TaxID=110542 RepID=A0ACB9ZGM1_9PEZI|nr:hypothetical protein F4820DRAFT_252951 [Hypoxylon rubiginosum]
MSFCCGLCGLLFCGLFLKFFFSFHAGSINIITCHFPFLILHSILSTSQTLHHLTILPLSPPSPSFFSFFFSFLTSQSLRFAKLSDLDRNFDSRSCRRKDSGFYNKLKSGQEKKRGSRQSCTLLCRRRCSYRKATIWSHPRVSGRRFRNPFFFLGSSTSEAKPTVTTTTTKPASSTRTTRTTRTTRGLTS